MPISGPDENRDVALYTPDDVARELGLCLRTAQELCNSALRDLPPNKHRRLTRQELQYIYAFTVNSGGRREGNGAGDHFPKINRVFTAFLPRLWKSRFRPVWPLVMCRIY